MQVVLCGAGVDRGRRGSPRAISVAAAFALGLPLALSSTAQVLPMLQSAGRLRTPFGERAFSILLFQDLSIVPLITIVAAMSRNPADAQRAAGLAAVRLHRRRGRRADPRRAVLLRPLFRLIGNLGEREMFVFAGAVHRASPRGADGGARAVDRARRVRRGRDARRHALSPRAGGRCRAVPLDPARACSSSRSA